MPQGLIADRWADAWYTERPGTNDHRAVSVAKQVRRIERRREARMTFSERCTLAINQWRARQVVSNA